MFKNNVFKANVSTKKWFKKAGIRALKTMAEVAGSMIVIGAFSETQWLLMLQTTFVSGLASMLISINGIPEVSGEEE